VIETDYNSEIVAISPTPDENEVSNLEREALRRGDDHAALCQITHNPAQTNSKPMAIISAVSCGTISACWRRAASRSNLSNIDTTVLFENFHDPDLKISRGRRNRPRLKLEGGNTGSYLTYP
jgi:hypothetical protein